MSSKSLKTGKDTYLCFGPALSPAVWPVSVANGFESAGGLAASLQPAQGSPEYKPTMAEIYARDQAVCGMSEWSKQCKTTATITRGSETTDTSDDCNPDETAISKLVRSISFEAFNRKKKDSNMPIQSIIAMRNVYESAGCLVLPVLWTDAAKTDDGAVGEFMIAAVSDFSTSGALNDPVSVSVTLVPTSTPERSADSQPMLNQFPVLCAAELPSGANAKFYYGELSRYGSSEIMQEVLTFPAPA